MPQTATCYHNSLTLKWILIHHVREIVFVPARTFGAWVALPLCSLHFFRLVFHALQVMMQTDASWASNRARSCQPSFSGAELPCYYITRLPNRFRIEMRRDESVRRRGRFLGFFSTLNSQGRALAVPSGMWRLTFAPGQPENLNFFHTNLILGVLDCAS